jgi:hypothetical protein
VTTTLAVTKPPSTTLTSLTTFLKKSSQNTAEEKTFSASATENSVHPITLTASSLITEGEEIQKKTTRSNVFPSG